MRIERIQNGCVLASIRWLMHTGREVPPSGLKPGAGVRGGPSGLKVFCRLGKNAGCAAQTTIEHGESPDAFLIFAQDPLPLRLCAFAPLRSFLPAARISARDPLPLRLCVPFFQQPGSLREIHYLCAFAFLSSSSRDLCARSTTQRGLRLVFPPGKRPARDRWIDFQEP